MRYKLLLSITIACLCIVTAHAQCPNATDINATNVCGLYGDGNGNSNWNWELNDPLNPAYCNNWYGRTGPSGFLSRMGSPFVNAGTGKLKIIADNGDYTKERGWELLQRKFGCQSDITNPYFILYNRYTGMMRVYVYLTAGSYSQLLMTIKSVYDHRPATIATANDIMYAPDKYFNNQAGMASDDIMISLNESVGTNQWAVAEYYMMLDDRIAESVYNNGSLQITVYGVTNSSLEAVIEGTSCPGSGPCGGSAVKDAAFKTKNVSSGGSSFNFTANGENLLKFSKSFSEFVDGVHKSSQKIATKLWPLSLDSLRDPISVIEKFGKLARRVELNTADSASFAKIVTSIGSFLGTAGQVLKFAGSVIGFFKGSDKSAAAPAFTTYNFTLRGSISSQVVIQNLVLKIPGTSAPPTNANNATYYSCPMGVFNLKNTPMLDTLSYDRRAMTPQSYNPKKVPKTIKYAAYRLHNDVQVMVNAGAGMSVLKVEGALVAKVITPVSANPDPNFTVWIGPLENFPVRGNYTYFNHMRADIEANRLEITHYDTDNETYHIIQTPFYPLECMQRASINVHIPVMKVFLRLRATLKRTDNLGELVYFIKDYELDKQVGNLSDIPSDIWTNLDAIPPYASYTVPPNTFGSANPVNGNVTVGPHDFLIGAAYDENWTQPQEFRRNHTITTSSNHYVTISNTQPQITWRAGASITLNPKFQAVAGSTFLATVDWGYSSLPCNIAPAITNYVYTGNCYSSNIIAQRVRNELTVNSTENTEGVYPNPASTSLVINTLMKEKIKSVKIVDISGRIYNLQYNILKGNQLQLDVSRLVNGSYVAAVSTEKGIASYKFVIFK